MKAIILIAYFAAALLCVLGANKSIFPKWTHAIGASITSGSRTKRLASRTRCDIPKFENCLLTFFGHFGLSSTTLPSADDFLSKLASLADQDPPEGFSDACSYLSELSKCAPPSNCWKIDSMQQLDFPDVSQDAIDILFNLWRFQHICKHENFETLSSVYCEEFDENSCPDPGDTCEEMEAYLTCSERLYSEKCNKDAGKATCRAMAAAVKGIFPTACPANDLDKACNKAGGLNDSFYSLVLALFVALAVTILKHA